MSVSKELLLDLENVSNPFEHRIYLNKWQKLQLIFMSLTVFPLRVAGLLLTVLLLCAIAALGTVGLPLVPKKPIEGWRRQLSPAVKCLLRLVYFCCGYHKISVRGQENLNQGHDPDIVVAAPHSTFFDPIALFALNELPTGVSRIENIQLPFLGCITKFFSPICVSRSDLGSRRETVSQIKARVLSRMMFRHEKVEEHRDGPEDGCHPIVGMNWSPICLFPEGTTGNGKNLITFKIGAFIPGEAVQPICVQHVNSMDTTSWTWVGEGVWKILWMTMCQFSTTAILTILPEYRPSAEEKQNPHLYASNVQGFMSSQMGIPAVDFNFFDGPFVVYLSKLYLQPLPSLVRLKRILNDIAKRSDIDFSKMAEDLARSDLHLTKYLLTFEGFSKFIEGFEPLKLLLNCGVSCQQLFQSIASIGSEETIDMRRFFVWLCLSLQPQRTWAVVEIAFKAFSSDGKETLTKPQLIDMLSSLFQCYGVELEVMLDYISDCCCDEPSLSDFVKLTQDCDSNHSTCQCAQIINRFSISKPSLLKSSLNVLRKPWKNCSDCTSGSDGCGHDRPCKKLEKMLKSCRESHSLCGIWMEDGEAKKHQ